MAALYRLKYLLHYWTSLCFLGTFYVSAIEYCQKSENGISTGFVVNDCNSQPPPKLPDFPSTCSQFQACFPVTTTEPPSTSTWSTSDQPITDGTTISTTFTKVPPGDNSGGTTISTVAPGDKAGQGLPAWAIVIIVFAIILITIAVVGLTYLLLKKKNKTCKVHCGSDGDTSSSPKLSVLPLPLPNGKVTVLKHHQDGSLVLEPFVAAQNPSSCINSSSPVICPTSSSGALDQGNSSTPPIVGDAPAVQMPHVPDSTDYSRDRTVSTGSRAGDTTVLMPTSADTSQQPKKKKKNKKKDKKNTQSPIKLKPLMVASNPSEEVV